MMATDLDNRSVLSTALSPRARPPVFGGSWSHHSYSGVVVLRARQNSSAVSAPESFHIEIEIDGSRTVLMEAPTGRRSARSRRGRRIAPYSWLGTGAVALGIGAAALAGAGIAGADEGSESPSSEPNSKVERTPSTGSAANDTDASGSGPSGTDDEAASESDASPDDSDRAREESTDDAEVELSERELTGTKRASREAKHTDENVRTPVARERASVDVETAADDAVDSVSDGLVVAVAEKPSAAVDSPEQPKLSTSSVTADSTAAVRAVNLPSVSGTLTTLGSTLFGGPGAPAESPLGWHLLAAARRSTEGGSGADTSFAAAASNAAPTASLSRVSSPGWFTAKVTGSVKAADAEGNPLTYSVTPATHGMVTVDARGKFTYTPTAAGRHAAAATGATKTDSFTITVSDGAGGVASVPVTVNIRPANAAPSRLKATVGQPNAADGAVAGTIAGVDADGDSFTYTVTKPKNGSVTVNPNGTFTYTPTASARATARSTFFSDTDTFKVTVNDGHGAAKSITVRVTIAPSNSAPTAGRPTFGTPNSGSGSITGTVNAVDAERDKITYVPASLQTGRGTFTLKESGEFTYTPTASARHAAATGAPQAITDSVVVIVKDSAGAEGRVTVVIPISPANNAPARPLNPPPATPNPATGVTVDSVHVTDADGDALTYLASTPSKGAVVIDASGKFIYTPTEAARHRANADGATYLDRQDSFTVTVEDGHGGRIEVPVTVQIPPSSNAAPTNPGYDTSTNTGTGVVTGSVTATDADGDRLVFTGPATTPKGALVFSSDGRFTYRPTESARLQAGEPGADAATKVDSFVVTVNDGHGGTLAIPVSVNIVPIIVNQPPAAGTPVVGEAVPRTGVVTGTLGFTDPDDATLTYSVTRSPLAGTVALAPAGGFTYTPNSDLRPNVGGTPGTDSFVVVATDKEGRTAQVTVTVPVAPLAAATPGAVRRDPTTGNIAVKAARSTTAYEWVGFSPQTGSYPETNAEVVDWIDVWEPGSSTAGLTSGLNSYGAGSVKIDPNSSLVAMKSEDGFGPGEWFVFDPVNGGFYATGTWVGSWLDVYVAPTSSALV